MWLNGVSCVSLPCWDSGFEELRGLRVGVPNNFRLIFPWDYFGAIAGRVTTLEQQLDWSVKAVEKQCPLC